MNTRKKITIVAVVAVLAFAVVLIWTGANHSKSAAPTQTETQTSVEPTKMPTVAPTSDAAEDTNSTQMDAEKMTEEASENQTAQQTQAVEGSDGDVILVPETQDGQNDSAKANNKSSANEDSAKSASKEQNAGQQNKINPDTAGQSVELPMVPGLD